MKKGYAQFLDLAMLSLLKRGELHGYQIRKNLAEMAGSLFQFSFGSLYPALARLEERGAVVSYFESSPSFISSTGSLSGDLASQPEWDDRLTNVQPYDRSIRTKRIYRLTDLGEKLFDQLFENAPISSETEFMAWLYLADDRKLDLVIERSRERLAKLQATKRLNLRSTSTYSNTNNSARYEIHQRLVELHENEIGFVQKLLDKLTIGSLAEP